MALMAKKPTEAPPIYAIAQGDRLVGEMEADRDRLSEIPRGHRVIIDIRTAGRNTPRHRFYFAFLSKVIKATGCAPNTKALNTAIKMRTGYTEDVLMEGFIIKAPLSIAFDEMDEATFTQFLESALEFIARTYGVTPEDIGDAA
jgi:hypothetical protein